MVMRANTPRPSGTIARPLPTSWYESMAAVGSPMKWIEPPATGSIAVIALSAVVLPAPFAPISATSSPCMTSRSMPLTAWMPP
jgi:hypothetical protein